MAQAQAKAKPQEKAQYSQADLSAIERAATDEPTQDEIDAAVANLASGLDESVIGELKKQILADLAKGRTEAERTPGVVGGVDIKATRPGDIGKIERSRRAYLKEFYENEEKIPVSASPIYAPYVGRIQQIIVNDAWVTLPCNGETYPLPRTFADAWLEKKYAIDKIIAKSQRMADFDANRENVPGAISFD